MVGGREFEVSTRKARGGGRCTAIARALATTLQPRLASPSSRCGSVLLLQLLQEPQQPLCAAARVGVQKKTLAQAVVTYYAFSGEVVTSSFGEPEILCNNRGVDFVEVFADVELKELNLYNPDESIEGKFVPNKKHAVLAVQIDAEVIEIRTV